MPVRWPGRCALAAVLLLAGASAGTAAELTVVLSGVESTAGSVLVAVCKRARFLERDCRYTARAPAERGTTRVTVEGIAPGIYGVQAIHDADGDGDLARNLVGWPTEGMGFSNDARMRMGPPSFADAAVRIGPRGGRIDVPMRYY